VGDGEQVGGGVASVVVGALLGHAERAHAAARNLPAPAAAQDGAFRPRTSEEVEKFLNGLTLVLPDCARSWTGGPTSTPAREADAEFKPQPG
jgi:hypothetical protein